MNAIDLLLEQHREVDGLFAKLEDDLDSTILNELCDRLALHAIIEERIFYPAVRERRTEDILLEALEEHLSVKRLVADILLASPGDKTLEAKVMVLKEQVEHHVEEEETELLPKVRKLLGEDDLLRLGREMLALAEELEGAELRSLVLPETDEPARL